MVQFVKIIRIQIVATAIPLIGHQAATNVRQTIRTMLQLIKDPKFVKPIVQIKPFHERFVAQVNQTFKIILLEIVTYEALQQPTKGAAQRQEAIRTLEAAQVNETREEEDKDTKQFTCF